MPSRTVTGARQLGSEVELECLTAGSGTERHRAARVVVAAGRRQAPLPFDDDLSALVDFDERGDLIIEPDYSIRWKHADDHKIFVLNRGRYVQGLVTPT